MFDLQQFAPYKAILWILSLVGLLGLNGVFLYYALLHPDVMNAAQSNPISLVFMVEAFVLVALIAWGIWLNDLSRPGWIAFVVMSIVGSLAFSVPFFLLLHLRKVRVEAASRVEE